MEEERGEGSGRERGERNRGRVSDESWWEGGRIRGGGGES